MRVLSGNLTAFVGAALTVVLVSAGIMAFALPGGDDDDGSVLLNPTVTADALGESQTPRTSGAPSATSAPATSAPAAEPITAPFDLPVLMYHHVAPQYPAHEMEARLTVLSTDFDQQLAYLDCAGYTAITVADMFDAIAGVHGLPSRPIILTFDDGYADHYSQVFPMLQQHGDVGSFAIVTGFVESGAPYVNWAQVREMSDAGMEMLGHSVSHADLGASDDATVMDQLTRSRQALGNETGKSVDFLVYPSGEPFRSNTVERQQQVVEMARQAGYRGALLAGPNSLAQDPSAPFQVNRVRVTNEEDIYIFAASIGGPSPDEPCVSHSGHQ